VSEWVGGLLNPTITIAHPPHLTHLLLLYLLHVQEDAPLVRLDLVPARQGDHGDGHKLLPRERVRPNTCGRERCACT
jgi:hypothetical protein